MRPLLALTVIAALAAAPFAAAGVAASDGSPLAAWLLPFARDGPGHAGGMASDIACPLGDVNADNVDDLLMHTADGAQAKLQAVSGADPAQTLWELPTAEGETLTCAPDVAGDGIADPLLGLKDSAPALPGEAPLTADDAQATLQALDGVTGKPLLSLTGDESERSGDAAVAEGETSTTLDLEPGALDLLLFVKTTTTGAGAELPLGGLTLGSQREEVAIELLAADGTTRGVIETSPDADVLAFGLSGDATLSVIVVTGSVGSPLDEVEAVVPTVAAHALDGSVLWSVDLEAVTGELLLLPDAGDLDADGTMDLLVAVVAQGPGLPTQVEEVLALSGVDGSQILALTDVDGLLAALPLGDATPAIPSDPDALLLLTQETAGGALGLEAVLGAQTLWEAELPAGAHPVSLLTDAFTGDAVGFHDLTGDGVPDIAALVPADAGSTLQLIDGATGATVWTTAVASVDAAVAIAAPTGADLAIASTDAQAGTVTLTLIDGATGTVSWSAQAQLPADLEDAQASLTPFTGTDGASNVLMTVVEKAPAEPGAAPASGAAYVVDTATGATKTAKGTTPGATVPPLATLASEEGGSSPVPGAGAILGIGAVGVAAAVLRRRRA